MVSEKTICNMGLESKFGLMELFIKANIGLVKNMEKESLSGEMEALM